MTAPAPSPEQVEAAREFFGCKEGGIYLSGERDIEHSVVCSEDVLRPGVFRCERLARLLMEREARVREEERERCAKVAEDYSTCHLCAVCAPHPACEISQYDIASAIREGA